MPKRKKKTELMNPRTIFIPDSLWEDIQEKARKESYQTRTKVSASAITRRALKKEVGL